MAGTYDNEQQRIIDGIKCIAFREENRTQLFQDLLCSYPERVKAVLAANEKHTNY